MSSLDDLFAAYTPEAAAADAAQAERGNGPRRITLSKLDPGTYVFRILPAKPGRRSPLVVRGTHFIKRDGGQKVLAYPCSMAQWSKPCKACAGVATLHSLAAANPANSALLDAAKSMESNFSFMVAALDTAVPFNPESPGDSIVLLEGKRTVYNELLGFRSNPRGGDFSNPLTGFAVEITKRGAGMSTEYKVAIDSLGGRGPIFKRADGSPDVEMIRALLTAAPDPWEELRVPSAETEDDLDIVLAKLDQMAAAMGGVPPSAGVAAALGVPTARR